MALLLLSEIGREGSVNKRTYGILAGVIGFGAWWLVRRRNGGRSAASQGRGTVIFSNTPAPTPLSTEGII